MTEDLLQLLKKYDVPTPRYTSYPTVPYWDFSTLDEDQWRQSVIQTFNAENGLLNKHLMSQTKILAFISKPRL